MNEKKEKSVYLNLHVHIVKRRLREIISESAHVFFSYFLYASAFISEYKMEKKKNVGYIVFHK